ncbi:hypothetical protein KDK95_10025 [Actinospica sp. MGRD01-02]|uniref:Uncharacterized protein n=1 Tax=Actinospica acidithermotolerans TaxID=2828514 RepID=A0A941EA41_9ACTN|nr:hypothetical protein [Actinospica acidithermotolerans]MBR7826642.1 hypothetical protein [Actinospica acidithermotolerans]
MIESDGQVRKVAGLFFGYGTYLPAGTRFLVRASARTLAALNRASSTRPRNTATSSSLPALAPPHASTEEHFFNAEVLNGIVT